MTSVLPLEDINVADFYVWEKHSKTGGISFQKGLLLDDGFHRYVDFNQFEAKAEPAPGPSWKRKEQDLQSATMSSCDPTATMFKCPNPHPLDLLPSEHRWSTVDNGGTGFIVTHVIHQDKSILYVHGRPRDVVLSRRDQLQDDRCFTFPYATFKISKLFVGKSVLNEMTEFSGGKGPTFDGNSVVALIRKNQYLFVGIDCYTFRTLEPILAFHSSVGNSCVTYPYAETEHFIYDFSTKKRSNIELHPDRVVKGYVNENVGEPFRVHMLADRGTESYRSADWD